MSTIKLNFLILPILWLVCIKSETEGPSKNKLEFSLQNDLINLANKVAANTDPNERKNLVIEGFLGWSQKKKGLNFFYNFACFASIMRQDCEDAFKYFKETDFKDKEDIIHRENIKLPELFLNLNETRDQWMYEDVSIHGITIYIPNFTKAIRQKNTRKKVSQEYKPKLETYFQQWYYIVTVEPTSHMPYLVSILQKELQTYFSIHGQNYKDYDDMLKKFAGHIARSYIQACGLVHGRLTAMYQYGVMNPNKPFQELLLDFIPSWYVNSEQLTFLQILRAASQLPKKRNRNLQYEFLVIKNSWTSKPLAETEWVILPYYDANECSPMDIQGFATNTLADMIPYTPALLQLETMQQKKHDLTLFHF